MQANRGTAAEEEVILSCTLYDQRGQALIYKTAVPTGMTKDGRRFFTSKAPVDFVGVANGISVAFDVKSVFRGTTFAIAKLPFHQIEFGRRWCKQGGVAFLLIRFEDLGWRLATWPEVEKALKATRGGRHLEADDLVVAPGRPVDFLRAIGIQYVDSRDLGGQI